MRKSTIIIVVSFFIVAAIAIGCVCFFKNEQFKKQKEQVRIVTPYIVRELLEFKDIEKDAVKRKMFKESDNSSKEEINNYYGMKEIIWDGISTIDAFTNEIRKEFVEEHFGASEEIDRYLYRKDIFFNAVPDHFQYHYEEVIEDRFCHYEVRCTIKDGYLSKICCLTFYANENGKVWYEYVRNYCYENFIKIDVKEYKDAYHIYFE